MSRHLQSLQFLRFLASFLVLITHSGFYVHERLDRSFEYWHRGAAGVGLFFVISGLVIVISSEKLIGVKDDWKIFSVKRLLRIVPIYWLATTAKVLAMVLIASQVLHSEFDLLHIVKSYFFLPDYNPVDGKIQPLLGVGWTLVYEVFFYLLFGLALFLKLPPMRTVGALLIVLAIGSLFKDDVLDMQKQPLLYFLLDSVVLNFLLGMILGHIYKREIFLSIPVAIAAIVLGLLSITADIFAAFFPLPPLISIGVASFFVIWGAFSLERRRHIPVPEPFIFLGNASYSTYLFHPLIVPIVPTVFSHLGLIYPNIATAVGVALALGVASVIYVVLERPITQFLTARLPYAR